VQSTPETVASSMITPLRINAFGMLFLIMGLISLRTRLAARRLEAELGPPLPAPTAGALSMEGGA
jgi:hypothetical protein